MLPGDYFHPNIFAGFQEDVTDICDCHVIGVDNLLRDSDYSQAESTFPRTRQIFEVILVDCNEEEKEKIASGNAARIYHLTEIIRVACCGCRRVLLRRGPGNHVSRVFSRPCRSAD